MLRLPSLEQEIMEIFNEVMEDNKLSGIRIHYPINILNFHKDKSKYLFEPVSEEKFKVRRVSKRKLEQGFNQAYVTVSQLKPVEKISKKFNVLLPAVLGYGRITDNENRAMFSKKNSWLPLPKDRLEELYEICNYFY